MAERPASTNRRRGLLAAWLLVLGLTGGSAAFVTGLLQEQPTPAEAAPMPTTAAASVHAASSHAASLKLPVRPPADFRLLPAAEREAMVEATADGLRLPRISPGGWMPWIAYSRRYSADGPAARVGLLVINVGANEGLMQRSIDELPGEVSLAFLPGTPDLTRWMARAHERGHETYLMMPVEDSSGMAERGIRPIEAAAEPAENVQRLRATMARGEGYVGVVMPSPGPVSQQEQLARPLMQEIADRGLGLVEIAPPGPASAMYQLTVELGIGYARTSTVLDYKLAGHDVGASLDRLLDWTSQGRPERPRHDFGVLQPDAEAIDAIVAWRQRVSDRSGVTLVPLIGHFECRDACMARVRVQSAQLRP